MNELLMRMMMQMFSNASGGQQQNTQQQDTQESLANNLLSSATPALGTVATKLASGEKFNVGDIGSVLQGASPALNMIPGVGTIASAGTNILGSVLQGLSNKQEEFKAGQVLPQVSNPYMCGGRLKSYQFGGPMKQYNAPPHSMGGQAVDANGNPVMNPQQGAAEIEKQEMYSSAGPGDGFVFSDAITLPNGMTLAQKAAEIEKKFGKFDDAISRAAKERELKKLAEYGETMKQRMLEQQQQQQIQDMQRMQAGVPTDQQMQQQMMMQQGQMQQGMPQQQMQQNQMPMMQFGGNLKSLNALFNNDLPKFSKGGNNKQNTDPPSDSTSVASDYGINPLILDSILANIPRGGYGQLVNSGQITVPSGGYGQWGNSGQVTVPQEQSNSTEPPEQNRNFISRASEMLARAAVGFNELPENFKIPSTIRELFSNPIEGQTNFGRYRTSNPSFLRGLTRSSYLQDILSMPRVGINFSGLRDRSQDNNQNPWKLIQENNRL